MSQAWPWIAGALAVFWIVGLHNRLMRLRAVVFETSAIFERAMQALISVARDAVPSADAPSPIGAALLQAAAALETGLKNQKNPRRARLASQAPVDLGALWAHLQQAWLAHAVAVEGVCDPAALQALRERWDAADTQAPLARVAANHAIAGYQAALDQAPAAWVAGPMGFRAVAPL
jgi:LemA protein